MGGKPLSSTITPELRADILLEALPYIKKFHGKTVVIKYGGAAMDKADLRDLFARDVVLLQYVGIKPIIVHGGGPQINSLLKQLGVQSTFIDGHRVTGDAEMEAVEQVLAGSVNKSIVSLIQHEGAKAVGISGKDGGLAHAEKKIITRTEQGKETNIDIGRVGEVYPQNVNPELIETLLQSGFIPVIAPVAADQAGKSLNVNADTMAGSIASAMKAEKLILLTDTPGVMSGGKTITRLTPSQMRTLITDNTITGGMIPKVLNAVQAVENGVKRAHIIDGRVPHALLLEIMTNEGVGTLIARDNDLAD